MMLYVERYLFHLLQRIKHSLRKHRGFQETENKSFNKTCLIQNSSSTFNNKKLILKTRKLPPNTKISQSRSPI